MAELKDATLRNNVAPSTELKAAIRKDAPRKFRNKFVPFFEKKHKIKEKKKQAAAASKKEEAIAKAVAKDRSSLSKSPPNTTVLIRSPSNPPASSSADSAENAMTASVSSSYLDQLIEFERAEKKRLKDIQDKKEKPALIEDFPKPNSDESNQRQLTKAGPGWIPRLPIEPHGGVEYWKFHKFHTEAATIVLSLGETVNKNLWGTYVPQLAYNSGMLSNALVAFDALAMNRSKKDPNLAAVASEKFFQAVREMTQAIQYVSSMNFMEIYVTSYIVACFAITEPSVAPIVSKDNSQPEMFRIARGMFNPDLKVLNEKYKPPSHFLLPHQLSKPPDLNNLDLNVLNSTEVSFFKLLWDQLDSMEAGNTSISILCGPPAETAETQWEMLDYGLDISTLSKNGVYEEIQRSYEPVFGASSSNYQLFDLDDSSSPGVSDLGSSPEEFLSFSPEGIQTSPGHNYLSPSTSASPVLTSLHPSAISTTSPAPNSINNNNTNTLNSKDTLFTFLPGELETYRRTVLYMMHITYDSVKSNRSTILMFSFNTISDEFTSFLHASRPMALVITAYIMSVFQFKDRYMGDQGTYRHRMQELEGMTPEAWRPAFYWPKQILEQHRLHGSLAKLMKDLNLQDLDEEPHIKEIS